MARASDVIKKMKDPDKMSNSQIDRYILELRRAKALTIEEGRSRETVIRNLEQYKAIRG